MNRRTSRPISVVVILVAAVSIGFSGSGVAGAVGGEIPSADVGGQPGQLKADANVSQSNTSTANATVTFSNQTTNGSTVIIERATLPDGGFVAIHDSSYLTAAPADSSVIAVSKNLSAGTHRNVTVDVSNAPQGNFPGLNRTRLNASQTIVAVAYRDINGNGRFDFVRSVGENDGAYTSGGAPTSDIAGITIPRSEQPRPIASVTFADQQMRNNTLIVRRARLPEGGFIVAHNESYRRTGDPLMSAVGLSGYLPPGNHSNITLDVLPSALNRSQTVTVRPAMDTNDNQRYDYVRSNGFQDVGYSTRNRSATVVATARVTVPASQQPVQTATTNASSTAATNVPSPTASPTSTPASTTGTGTSTADESGGSGRRGSGLSTLEIVAGLALLVVVVLVVRRLR